MARHQTNRPSALDTQEFYFTGRIQSNAKIALDRTLEEYTKQLTEKGREIDDNYKRLIERSVRSLQICGPHDQPVGGYILEADLPEVSLHVTLPLDCSRGLLAEAFTEMGIAINRNDIQLCNTIVDGTNPVRDFKIAIQKLIQQPSTQLAKC